METAHAQQDRAMVEEDGFKVIDASHLDPRDPEWPGQMAALGIEVVDSNDLPLPILRTSSLPEGPYLAVTDTPPGSTDEQIGRAVEAAHRVFEEAGVDPVEAGYLDTTDPERERMLGELWAAAEQAATVACWAPRQGAPEPTKIDIYME